MTLDPYWDGHATGTYVSVANGEKWSSYEGRTKRARGRVPLLYFHGFFGDAYVLLGMEYQPLFKALADAAGIPALAPDMGGGSVWATSVLIGAGALADDALDFAAASDQLQTDPWKTTVIGVSMGSTNALPWCWNRQARIRSATMIGPIVWLEKFYNDNPSFQGAIDTSWGGHGNFVAALPSIDPWQNIDMIRPWAHRLHLYYAEADGLIDPDDVRAFAELTGCVAHQIDGTHADLVAAPADQIAAELLRTARDRQRFYIGWDDYQLGQIDTVPATLPAAPNNNINALYTEVAVGGRRGVWERISGGEDNERHALLFPQLSAPDMSVRTIWHGNNGGGMAGQQGNIMRADITATTYRFGIGWHNVLFGVPWIVNQGVWSGTIGANDLALVSANAVVPGLRLSAGGLILASTRQGNVVTIVVRKEDADRAFKGTVDVVFDGPGLTNYVGPVTRLDDEHLQFPQAGANVTSGGPGSWADFGSCFPYVADTELVRSTIRGRYYPIGMDPPAWDDTDWVLTWTDPGANLPTAYGVPGVMAGHVGIFAPDAQPDIQVQFGPLAVDEL